MNESIYPEQIKRFREKKRWSQEQLVLQINKKHQITTRQLQRLEQQAQSGEQVKVRSKTLDGLAAGLGVDRKILMQPPSSNRSGNRSAQPVQRLSVESSTVNNLKLIERRYNIPAEYVLKLAPLLFVYHAESSLRARQTRLDRMTDLFNALSEASPSLTHLLEGQLPDELQDEMCSIKFSDLAGPSFDVMEGCAPGEFALYLQEMVLEFDESSMIAIEDFHSGDTSEFQSQIPEYVLFSEDLDSLSSGDENIKKAILNGAIRLDKLPKFDLGGKESLSHEEWIRGEYERLIPSHQSEDADPD